MGEDLSLTVNRQSSIVNRQSLKRISFPDRDEIGRDAADSAAARPRRSNNNIVLIWKWHQSPTCPGPVSTGI
jgi:hypothetical protein